MNYYCKLCNSLCKKQYTNTSCFGSIMISDIYNCNLHTTGHYALFTDIANKIVMEWIYLHHPPTCLSYEIESKRTTIRFDDWLFDAKKQIEINPIAEMTPEVAQQCLERLKRMVVFQ